MPPESAPSGADSPKLAMRSTRDSIPLTMAVKIAMEEQPSTRWLALMLGSGAQAEVELARQRDLSSADKEPLRRAGLPS